MADFLPNEGEIWLFEDHHYKCTYEVYDINKTTGKCTIKALKNRSVEIINDSYVLDSFKHIGWKGPIKGKKNRPILEKTENISCKEIIII